MTDTYITAAYGLSFVGFAGLTFWLYTQRKRLRILIKALQAGEGGEKDV